MDRRILFINAGRKRILVVDDDGMMLRTMKNWLSKKYDVYMANSGMNAISLLAKNRVDLILLDSRCSRNHRRATSTVVRTHSVHQ